MYNNSQSICHRLLFVPSNTSDKNCFFNELSEAVTLTLQRSGWGECKNLQQMTVMDLTDPKIGRNEDYKLYSILKKH
jgi:hypothetical protein